MKNRFAIALLLAASPGFGRAAEPAHTIGTLWPMCPGWSTSLEEWQWIEPRELTYSRASKALQELGAVEGKRLEGDAEDAYQMNLQLVEGYRVLVMAKRDVSDLPKDSIGAMRHRKAVNAFCRWITSNAFPE